MLGSSTLIGLVIQCKQTAGFWCGSFYRDGLCVFRFFFAIFRLFTKKNRKIQSPSLYNEPHRTHAGYVYCITSPTNVWDQSIRSPWHPELENVFEKPMIFAILKNHGFLGDFEVLSIFSYFLFQEIFSKWFFPMHQRLKMASCDQIWAPEVVFLRFSYTFWPFGVPKMAPAVNTGGYENRLRNLRTKFFAKKFSPKSMIISKWNFNHWFPTIRIELCFVSGWMNVEILKKGSKKRLFHQNCPLWDQKFWRKNRKKI